MPKQEKIKSILFTGSGEFRVSVVQTLNTLGFTAEKTNADSLASLAKVIKADPLVWNVVIDMPSVFPNDAEYEARFRDIDNAIGGAQVSVLVYLPADKFEPLTYLTKAFTKLHFRPLPVRRQDFVDGFIKPFMARHGHGKVEKASPKSGPSSSGESIGEAIEHAKQTIELLKKVATDVHAVEPFIAIGQRFNGMYGAYLFLGGKDGYQQLKLVCGIVDALSKTYARGHAPKALAKAHVELMVRAAKCIFGILKEMRAGKAVTPELKSETDQVCKAYAAMTDVFRREAMSQDLVDELLNKHSA